MTLLQGLAGLGIQALVQRLGPSGQPPFLPPRAWLKRVAALALAGVLTMLAVLLTLMMIIVIIWPALTLVDLLAVMIGLCLVGAIGAYTAAAYLARKPLLPPENFGQRLLQSFKKGWGDVRH